MNRAGESGKVSNGICRASLALMSIAILAASPALGVAGAQGSLEDLFAGVTTLLAPFTPHSSVNIDGAISPGEYDASVVYTTSDTGISFSMIHDNDSLYLGIQGPTWGWIAFGASLDSGESMAFIVISGDGSDYTIQERTVSPVSEDMTFQSPEPDMHAVSDFEATTSGGITVAEVRISLEVQSWSLQPGTVYPTVVATNMTASPGHPSGISGEGVHFVGSYLLRPGDDVKNVDDLLNGKTSPVPSVVAVVILSIGIIAIITEFVVRRREP